MSQSIRRSSAIQEHRYSRQLQIETLPQQRLVIEHLEFRKGFGKLVTAINSLGVVWNSQYSPRFSIYAY